MQFANKLTMTKVILFTIISRTPNTPEHFSNSIPKSVPPFLQSLPIPIFTNVRLNKRISSKKFEYFDFRLTSRNEQLRLLAQDCCRELLTILSKVYGLITSLLLLLSPICMSKASVKPSAFRSETKYRPEANE